MILRDSFLSIFIFVSLNIFSRVNSQQRQYLRWVRIVDPGVIQVPPDPVLEQFQFFVNVDISGGLSAEQCDPSGARNESLNPKSNHAQQCYNVKCIHEVLQPLENYLIVNGDRTDAYKIEINSSNDNYTWTSRILWTSPPSTHRYLAVSVISADELHSTKVAGLFPSSVRDSEGQPPYESHLSFYVSGNVLSYFDYWSYEYHTIEITEEPPYTISLSHSNTGVIYSEEVKMYNTTATTGEIYKMWTGEDIPERLVRHDCECPRLYVDTYSLIEKGLEYYDPGKSSAVPENLCYGFDHSPISRYTGQYQGKWAIFTEDGWVSGFTDEVEILLSMPQTMLTYAVTGRFIWKENDLEPTAIHRPESMELSIESSTSNHPYTVYISSDCESDYNMDTSSQPMVMLCGDINSRNTGDNIVQRCFGWEDLLYIGGTVAGYQYLDWEIPLLVPPDEQLRLDDAFKGERVKIKLIGHYSNSTAGPQDWYHVGGLSLYLRPHCGGKNYNLIMHPPVMKIVMYADFYADDTTAYTCRCPQSMIDDECGNCSITDQPYRYMAADGLCTDCDCTDLSESKYCNHSTGQCPCRPLSNGQEVSTYNRICEWSVTEILPQYGPIAGGTIITVYGDYIDEPDVNISATLDGKMATVENSDQSLEIHTKAGTEIGSRNLTLHPTTTQNVGKESLDVPFEYKPNPVLENIKPLKSIISGGMYLTVTGLHMGSVYSPKLLVYAMEKEPFKEQNILVLNCDVISNKTLHCLTPNWTEEVNISRQGKQELLSFNLGMRFDGHTTYEYLANNTQLRYISILSIYDDPIIYTFNDSFGYSTLNYTRDDNTMEVKGERLDWGAASGDYLINIGEQGNCTVVNQTSDILHCTPPRQENLVPENDKWSFNVTVTVGNIETQVGYINYLDSPDATLGTNDGAPTSANDEASDGITVTVIGMIVMGAVLSLVLVVAVTCFVIKRRQRKNDSNAEEDTKLGDILQLFEGKELCPNIYSRIERCKIPKERLNVGQQIGKGNFGFVYKGQLMTLSGSIKSVAIKSLKGDMSFDDFENFLSEGTLMIDFKHENVMSLLGVVFETGEKPLVILPYMEKGDLRSFVQQDNLDLLLGDVLHFGYQISNGMDYLVEKQFVHRDLAARNCMVNSANIVKVADFGMSRDINEKDYYRLESMNKPLPIRWMAIESMRHGTFNVKTDVWAFGITMWELFSRGATPFDGLRNRQVMDQTFAGMRLHIPEACPPIVYDMMISCWNEDPSLRPDFVAIGNSLKALLSGEEVPQAGSDRDAGFYYERNVTRDVPDDYYNVADDEDDDYIIPF